MGRPDYIVCVQHDMEPRKHETYCGKFHLGEFILLGASHAATVAYSQSRLLICSQCAGAIKELLGSHTGD